MLLVHGGSYSSTEYNEYCGDTRIGTELVASAAYSYKQRRYLRCSWWTSYSINDIWI